jgi:hypothetical protein
VLSVGEPRGSTRLAGKVLSFPPTTSAAFSPPPATSWTPLPASVRVNTGIWRSRNTAQTASSWSRPSCAARVRQTCMRRAW